MKGKAVPLLRVSYGAPGRAWRDVQAVPRGMEQLIVWQEQYKGLSITSVLGPRADSIGKTLLGSLIHIYTGDEASTVISRYEDHVLKRLDGARFSDIETVSIPVGAIHEENFFNNALLANSCLHCLGTCAIEHDCAAMDCEGDDNCPNTLTLSVIGQPVPFEDDPTIAGIVLDLPGYLPQCWHRVSGDDLERCDDKCVDQVLRCSCNCKLQTCVGQMKLMSAALSISTSVVLNIPYPSAAAIASLMTPAMIKTSHQSIIKSNYGTKSINGNILEGLLNPFTVASALVNRGPGTGKQTGDPPLILAISNAPGPESAVAEQLSDIMNNTRNPALSCWYNQYRRSGVMPVVIPSPSTQLRMSLQKLAIDEQDTQIAVGRALVNLAKLSTHLEVNRESHLTRVISNLCMRKILRRDNSENGGPKGSLLKKGLGPITDFVAALELSGRIKTIVPYLSWSMEEGENFTFQYLFTNPLIQDMKKAVRKREGIAARIPLDDVFNEGPKTGRAGLLRAAVRTARNRIWDNVIRQTGPALESRRVLGLDIHQPPSIDESIAPSFHGRVLSLVWVPQREYLEIVREAETDALMYYMRVGANLATQPEDIIINIQVIASEVEHVIRMSSDKINSWAVEKTKHLCSKTLGMEPSDETLIFMGRWFDIYADLSPAFEAPGAIEHIGIMLDCLLPEVKDAAGAVHSKRLDVGHQDLAKKSDLYQDSHVSLPRLGGPGG